jgi:DNA-binding MarR family transcriptional regulator
MVYGMLFAVSNRIQTYGDNQFDGITIKQHFLMVVLELFGSQPPTLKELSDAVGCSYQNVKRMLTALEKNGYVIITGNDKDKRKLQVVITDKFHTLNRNYEKQTEEFINRLYKGISEEELQFTAGTLKKMETNILKACKGEKDE